MMTQTNLLPVILLAGIGLIMGILVGILLAALRRTNNPASPKEAFPKGLKQSLRLWSDENGDVTVIETDKGSYYKVDELNQEQKTKIAKILSPLINIANKPVPEIISPQLEPSPAYSVSQSESVQPETLVSPVPPTPPKQSLVDMIASASRPAQRVAPEPTKSIAAQVDEILQSQIQGTSLENRAIRLMEIPGKGMVVMIGLDQYASVSEVPDPEIQAVLRKAVSEWEDRTLSSSI